MNEYPMVFGLLLFSMAVPASSMLSLLPPELELAHLHLLAQGNHMSFIFFVQMIQLTRASHAAMFAGLADQLTIAPAWNSGGFFQNLGTSPG